MLIKTHKNNIVYLIWFFLLIIVYLSLPYNYESTYLDNLLVDIFAVLLVLYLLFEYRRRFKNGLLDPIYFFSAMYLMLYFVAPIYDILIKEYTWFGYYLFQYGVKASIISLIGYLAFYLIYVTKFSLKDCYTRIKPNTVCGVVTNRNEIITIILAMYIVCFIGNAIYLLNYGFSNLTYILTLGLVGEEGTTAVVRDDLGFVSMLSYALPTTTLLYWEYGRSKSLKIILFIPMFMMQVARGFRFLIIQIVVTFLAYYCISKKKKIKLRTFLLPSIILLAFILLMTMFRDTIRSGGGIDFSAISSESIKDAFDEAFWKNLRIYRNFYGMVNAIPSEYGFVFGRQMIIGTIVMVIPRMIWPGKISSYGGVGLTVLIGGALEGTGQAYPTIGEYYYALGVLGVIICMALFGGWAKRLRDKYMRSQDPLDVIIFAVLLGCFLQLIIRGYFPSNFWYLVFSIIPVYVVKLLRKTTYYIETEKGGLNV